MPDTNYTDNVTILTAASTQDFNNHVYRDQGQITNSNGTFTHMAVGVGVTPAGTISSTNTQAAIQELDGDVQAVKTYVNTQISAVNVTIANMTKPSISALRVATGMFVGQVVQVMGYYTPGDGGGNTFTKIAATQGSYVDNGGTIIVASDGGVWQATVSNTVNVKQFGAYGDNTHDDTTAIQKAITYRMTTGLGGSVYFPAGNYLVSSQINIPVTTNVSLLVYGEGPASKLVGNSSGGTFTIFMVGGAIAVFGSLHTFRGLQFAIPKQGSTNGIWFNNANTCKIEDCSFYNQVSGVVLQSSYANTIDKTFFYGCSSYGITTYLTGTNNLVVSQCGFNTNSVCINMGVGGNNIVIRDCDMEGTTGNEIILTSYTSVLIQGNYIETGSSSTFGLYATNGLNYQIDIVQNWFGQAPVTDFHQINGGTFKGNTLYNHQFTMGSNMTDFIIGNNYLLGTSSIPVSSWANANMLNGFTARTGSYGNVQYIKDSDGVVYLRGSSLGGTVGLAAFNLPSGYRPTNYQTFASACDAGPQNSTISIRPTGDVVVLSGAGAGGTGYDGICFLSS